MSIFDFEELHLLSVHSIFLDLVIHAVLDAKAFIMNCLFLCLFIISQDSSMVTYYLYVMYFWLDSHIDDITVIHLLFRQGFASMSASSFGGM